MTHAVKPALTPAQLVDKLAGQGMIIPNKAAAANYLQHVGGFRFKGYWFHLQDPTTKTFPAGLTFQDIVDRYEFDKKLRALAFDAIERLEVAIRSSISNYLSLKYDPHWYMNNKIFKPSRKWGMGSLLKKIEDEVGRSTTLFIEKHNNRQGAFYLPECWMVTECVTFGLWSRTYAFIAEPNDRKAISMKFGIAQPEVFESWIHALSYFRNVVAHHSRILKCRLVISPQNYKQQKIKLLDPQSFYAIATVINVLLQATSLPNSWKADLVSLFSAYPKIPIQKELGFPANWSAQAGW